MAQAPPPPALPVLLSPPAFDPLSLAGDFARALRALPVAAFILDTPDAGLRRAACEPMRDAVQTADVALLIAEDVALAMEEGADGVHFAQPPADPRTVRARLGEDAQWGAVVAAGRHAGMELADAGADYVAMDVGTAESEAQLRAVLGWWAEMVEVPVMLIGWQSAGALAPLLPARPDFIAVPAPLWTDPVALSALVAMRREVVGDG